MSDYKKIINRYGVNAQLKKLSEEVYEFEEAVLEKHNKEHITEEIADILVILTQFIDKYNIDVHKIDTIMQQKVDRQLRRMEGKNENNKI